MLGNIGNKKGTDMSTADAIRATLESPNVCDSNGEVANVVDVISQLAHSTNRIAQAITPSDAAAGRDAADGHVTSLTEAVMGLTAGMIEIAGAIKELAGAVDDHAATQHG